MKIRRHLIVASLLCAAATLTLSSCSDDNDWADVDGAAPELQLEATASYVEPGMDITLKGTVKDADGISTISLTCPELYLDKTIDIIAIYGEPLKEYNLDYTFQTERHADGEEFVVEIAVTDVGGRVYTENFGANLNADFTPPYFNARPAEKSTVLIKDETKIKLNIDIADNRVVDYLDINLVKVDGGTETQMEGYPIHIAGGERRLQYTNAIAVPNEPAVYKVTITAADREVQEPAHVITTESLITVTELPDFDAIYLADVATAEELNGDLFGVPMAMDHIGPYKYRVRYYNEKAGTEVCFLGQQSDFYPICFGPSKENPQELGNDYDEVNRVKLDKAGVYYLFEVDTWNQKLTMSDYPVASAINPVMNMKYGDNYLWTWSDNWVSGDWMQEFYFGPSTGPGDPLHMEQDAKNPNIFYCYNIDPKKFEDKGYLRFIVHNWHSHGWWNYATWRCDNSDSPSRFEYYGAIFPDNQHFTGNMNFFDWKYNQMDAEEFAFRYPGQAQFDAEAWNDGDNGRDGYRKLFVPDNWVKVPMPGNGKYTFKLDIHAERGMMYIQK